jgi:hypothetical protein
VESNKQLTEHDKLAEAHAVERDPARKEIARKDRPDGETCVAAAMMQFLEQPFPIKQDDSATSMSLEQERVFEAALS